MSVRCPVTWGPETESLVTIDVQHHERLQPWLFKLGSCMPPRKEGRKARPLLDQLAGNEARLITQEAAR